MVVVAAVAVAVVGVVFVVVVAGAVLYRVYSSFV